MKSKNRYKQWTLTKPCLLMCEGEDAKSFLIQLLVFHKGRGKEKWSHIDVANYGGIKELTLGLKAALNSNSGSGILKSILILRDAEKDAAGAVKSICSSLEKVKLANPGRVNSIAADSQLATAFSLFPNFDAETNGTLEDLCMKLICEDCYPRLSGDINDFIAKVEDKYQRPISHWHKSQLHTYFSVSEGLIGLKLGQAAQANAYDLDSPELAPLFKLLDDMTTGVS